FQAEDGIRDFHVTGVQTCALPILDSGLAALRYQKDVNGSLYNIAGLCDNSGQVFGLMPHPECTIWEKQLPDRRGFTVGRTIMARSEERRVGKECRYRRSRNRE